MCFEPRRRIGGFTLIELLVAISILAIVAVLGWRGLDGIIRARVALTTEMEQMRGLRLAFAQLQSDCANIATVAELPDRQTLVAQDDRVTIVRTIAIEDQPSLFEIVSYRSKNGVLTRRESNGTRDLGALDLLWQAAISDVDSSAPVSLQTDVTGMKVRAWQDGGWTSGVTSMKKGGGPDGATPPPASMTGATFVASLPPAPTALQIELQLKGRENGVLKVFMVGSI